MCIFRQRRQNENRIQAKLLGQLLQLLVSEMIGRKHNGARVASIRPCCEDPGMCDFDDLALNLFFLRDLSFCRAHRNTNQRNEKRTKTTPAEYADAGL